MVPLPVAGAFDRVAVDCLGPLPLTENGNQHIVIFSDYLTRWIEAFCVPDIKASTIAQLFVDEIISRHGAPRELLSDQGTNFLSKLVAEVCELFQTRKVNTTPYHPACDGLLERFNRTLLAMLACFVSSHQRDWDRFVPLVLFAYRCSAQASVGDSPFFLIYGLIQLFQSMLRSSQNPGYIKKLKITELIFHSHYKRHGNWHASISYRHRIGRNGIMTKRLETTSFQ